jgi:hypothetical protein
MPQQPPGHLCPSGTFSSLFPSFVPSSMLERCSLPCVFLDAVQSEFNDCINKKQIAADDKSNTATQLTNTFSRLHVNNGKW